MNSGKWKHKNCSDMAIKILGVISETQDFITLKVLYFNTQYNYYFDNSPDLVTIFKKDFPNWTRI